MGPKSVKVQGVQRKILKEIRMKDFHKEEEIRTTRVCKTPYNIDFFFLVNTGSKEGDEVQNEGYFKSIEQVRERS